MRYNGREGRAMGREKRRREADRTSFRTALRELQRAYSDPNAGHVIHAYDDARRRSRLFGVLTAAIERIYPVREFLRLAADLFDPAIGEYGLHGGCRRILDALPLEWECVLPQGAIDRLRTAPVIFYGNHPSLLTPFLLAASIDREDVSFLSTSYVRRLIPSFRDYCLRLEVSLTRSWTEWRRGGLRRALAYRLLSLIHAVPSPAEAKRINRQAIEDALARLRAGESIMIIPGGGGKRDRKWFPGIGIIARRLVEEPGREPAWVVPVREENSSNQRLYAMLMHGILARARRRRFDRLPVRFLLAAPTPLVDVVGTVPTVEGAVAALRSHCRRAFPESD
jgi:hypothetical protein